MVLKWNILLAAFITCLLSSWAVADTANDIMKEDNKFIKRNGLYFWLSKIGVMLFFIILGGVLFKSFGMTSSE